MKIDLIDYTGFGTPDPADHAANVLIFTKSTRLAMSPSLFADIASWPKEKIEAELLYMANTIPSSWEFVHYTFIIQNVTRAFTHQFVRTRSASYAQQTMRVLAMEGWTFGIGPSLDDKPTSYELYTKTMNDVASAYKAMLLDGCKIEDARGILPTNIHTNIVMNCNLRTFVETVRKRSSPRVQGEYREVIEKMAEKVLEVHPWAKFFVDRTFDRAAKDLDCEIQSIEDPEKRTRMVKLVDQLRQIGS